MKYKTENLLIQDNLHIPPPPKPKKGQKKQKFRKFIFKTLGLFLTLGFWGFIGYSAYNISLQYHEDTKKYVNSQINEVKLHNDKEIQLIKSQMEQMESQILVIKEEMSLADETISGTNETKMALQQRIVELDKQLNELKSSLKKLEETTRAW